MRMIKFNHAGDYHRVQRRSQMRKSRRPNLLLEEVEDIADCVNFYGFDLTVKNVMCHGARYGQEIVWFHGQFPGAEVLGTDLFPKHPAVLKWDFHESREEWRGKFDLIYTNSLDHSHSPEQVVKCWLDQLNDQGLLFVKWSPWHVTVQGGDCFGAQLYEYICLLDYVGKVVDVVYHRASAFSIAVRKRHESDEPNNSWQRIVKSSESVDYGEPLKESGKCNQ